jgi:hypothetical protein
MTRPEAVRERQIILPSRTAMMQLRGRKESIHALDPAAMPRGFVLQLAVTDSPR